MEQLFKVDSIFRIIGNVTKTDIKFVNVQQFLFNMIKLSFINYCHNICYTLDEENVYA